MQKFISCETKSTHQDLLPALIQRDQSDVQIVKDTITLLFIHPFSEIQLVSLSSSIVPAEKIENDMLEAESKGEEEMKSFIEDHLVNQTVDFYDPIKWL